MTVIAAKAPIVAPTGSTLPDSLTFGGGSLWVEYGNGADATGAGGSTTVVRYSTAGISQATFTIPGLADGLKYDAGTNTVWALMNNDGNSTLTLINALTGSVSPSLNYANNSATSGYDDVVFSGNTVYLSYTNPSNPGDPVIVSLDNGPTPFGDLTTTPVLAFGATGTNLLTGATETLPLNDPDSLKISPTGSLMLTSGDDGSLVFVNHPGTATQSESFIHIPGAPMTGAGLDDTIIPTAANGTLYVADQHNNVTDKVSVTGFAVGDIIASVGGLNEVVEVNPTTGATNVLLSGLSGPHGMVFVADNGTIANDVAPPQSTSSDDNLGEVTRLYQAAFNRAPDAAGLQHWTSLLNAGADTAAQVAQGFVGSGEYATDLGGLGQSAFVAALYSNTFGRAPATAETQFWTQVLMNGATKSSVLLGFSDSVEARSILAPQVAVAHTTPI